MVLPVSFDGKLRERVHLAMCDVVVRQLTFRRLGLIAATASGGYDNLIGTHDDRADRRGARSEAVPGKPQRYVPSLAQGWRTQGE